MNNKKEIEKLLEKNNLNIDDVIVLNNRYILQEEIDSGGLSIVYKAIDIYNEYFNDESNIVIKIPNENLRKKKDINAFVYSEYKFLRKLNHENIVKIYDFAVDKKTKIPYIVLEYISGEKLINESIYAMNKKSKNIMFYELFNTLKYIHKNNIIHADINPYNIMKEDDKYTIFDFGVSQNESKHEKFNLQYDNVKAFNPLYSSPEVLNGEKPSKYSDIFSFACVMYEIYTKKQIFKESSLELLDNKNLITKNNAIPLILRSWFKSALSIHKEDRNLDINFIKYLV